MTNLAFAAPPTTTARIHASEDLFPVRRVFCIGRNYAAHAREMGRDPDREPPFFFTKWAETVVQTPTIAYPPETANYHHEAELVLAIGARGHRIAATDAARHVFGCAAGLDMTRRDLQLEARNQGRPWDTGKNVEASAPIGPIHRLEGGRLPNAGRIELRVNDEVKQHANLADMIWSCAEIVAHVSRYYTLEPGDLIFTGTPEGVGPVRPGDRLSVSVADLEPLRVQIAAS